MAFRGGVVGCLVLALTASAAIPTAAANSQSPVVIRGVGAAHGFGLAMDGVEGQARAGWSHDRILSLFYPGTAAGQAGGTIRVGLAETQTVALGVPGGGTLSDAPRGAGAGAGFPVPLAPGGRVTLRAVEGGVAIESGVKLPDAPKPEAASAQDAEARATEEEPTPPPLLPTPPPPPGLEPSPTPPAKKVPSPGSDPERAPASARNIVPSVWVWGAGEPALVGVDATGRRYRGVMEVKPRDGKLTVVNHVDLETYVAGIAEEKGQAWPIEGLKTLAIAARSLAAATMSWYTKNTANGYDICPTANCQLYLGYDGEEPAMTQAVAATAGQIRTFNGRPILAMYHGNGGGQTESYKKAIGGGSDPHPYLTSVKYPFAAPSRWRQKTTLGGIEAALRSKGVAIPGALRKIEVTERGESPRVLSMRLSGADGSAEVTGTQFAAALALRSTWFELGHTNERSAFVSSDVFPGTIDPTSPSAPSLPSRNRWTLPAMIGIACLFALATATGIRGGAAAGAIDPLRRVAAGRDLDRWGSGIGRRLPARGRLRGFRVLRRRDPPR